MRSRHDKVFIGKRSCERKISGTFGADPNYPVQRNQKDNDVDLMNVDNEGVKFKTLFLISIDLQSIAFCSIGSSECVGID